MIKFLMDCVDGIKIYEVVLPQAITTTAIESLKKLGQVKCQNNYFKFSRKDAQISGHLDSPNLMLKCKENDLKLYSDLLEHP